MGVDKARGGRHEGRISYAHSTPLYTVFSLRCRFCAPENNQFDGETVKWSILRNGYPRFDNARIYAAR